MVLGHPLEEAKPARNILDISLDALPDLSSGLV